LSILGIRDTIREEVPLSIKQCHIAGIDVKMVTGDNKITARAIAKNVGIITEENEQTAMVLEGPEFLRLIGGVTCDNCREKESCDCVRNESERN
jgi:Ca2+ transporting ATPase